MYDQMSKWYASRFFFFVGIVSNSIPISISVNITWYVCNRLGFSFIYTVSDSIPMSIPITISYHHIIDFAFSSVSIISSSIPILYRYLYRIATILLLSILLVRFSVSYPTRFRYRYPPPTINNCYWYHTFIDLVSGLFYRYTVSNSHPISIGVQYLVNMYTNCFIDLFFRLLMLSYPARFRYRYSSLCTRNISYQLYAHYIGTE